MALIVDPPLGQLPVKRMYPSTTLTVCWTVLMPLVGWAHMNTIQPVTSVCIRSIIWIGEVQFNTVFARP